MEKRIFTSFIPVIIVYLVWGFFINKDDTDKSTFTKSGVALRTDYKTGCQYLEGTRGGLTPRVDGVGYHMGCHDAPH